MRSFKEFWKDETGIGTVEMILILVVLIGLVLIFKKQLTNLVNSIFKNRIEKGNFSKMQLSAEDMIKLKTYFIENAFHKASS